MRRIIHLKFISWALLTVILSVTIHCAHEGAHAMQRHATTSSAGAALTEMSATHQCPCSPGEQHNDFDACDSCAHCACHAPLTIQPFQFNYNPVIVYLTTSDPFTHLPEVYLSKFIPPQIQA